MDGSRFDDLTRFMAETPSRRTVVKALVGAIAGSLASVGTVLGAPRCKRVSQACQTTADCCPGPNANGNVYCKQISKNAKVCAACPPEAPIACGGGCVNTSSDNNNCGGCGVRCGGGTNCVDGVCQCPGANEALCGGTCVDLNSNANCGACGVSCPAGSTCVGGSCICPTATPSVCDGTCVNKSNDRLNCGSCGTVCFGGSTCVNGACRCPGGTHFDASGNCVCLGTTCTSASNCCSGYVCGDSGTCIPCAANGSVVNNEAKCCTSTAVDNVCVERCSSDADCAAGTGQVCEQDGIRRVCGCPAGEHMVAGGDCICADTTCADRDDCCDGYVCNASSQCVTCKPAGSGLTRQEIIPDPCCGEAACDTGEPNDLCTCVNTCTTVDDCQPGTGQVCLERGVCACPLGRVLSFDGSCKCGAASCTQDSQCCAGQVCDLENFVCKAA